MLYPHGGLFILCTRVPFAYPRRGYMQKSLAGRRNQSLHSQNLLASSDAAVSIALVAEPVSLLSESHLRLIARYCLVEGHSLGVEVGFLGEGEPASHVRVDCDSLGEQVWPSALRLYPSLAGLVRAPDAG